MKRHCSILGNHLSKYRDCIPRLHFDRISINVADFDPNLWHTLALSIMQNLFYHSGAVDWGVCDDGTIIGEFAHVGDVIEVCEIQNVYVDAKLIRRDGKTFLVIVKGHLDPATRYKRVLHVTHDGMWLAPDRDVDLEDAIENTMDVDKRWNNAKGAPPPKIRVRLEYDDQLYEILSQRNE